MSHKILVCDDDSMVREIVHARLSAHGFSVATARDGREALAIGLNEVPHLIVLDAMMPGMDGFECLGRIKASARLSEVPVVMLTACAEQRDIENALNAGADDYLVKPFVPGELIARLNRILRRTAQAR